MVTMTKQQLLCQDEGHLPPFPPTAGEGTVNCIRCGRCMDWDGLKDKYVARPEVPESEKPVDKTFAYFNWRSDNRGGATCYKILREHVDHWRGSDKTRYAEYETGLLQTHNITEEQYKLSLAKLTELFSYKEVANAPKQSD